MRERGAYLQTVHSTYRERGCNKARDVKRKRGERLRERGGASKAQILLIVAQLNYQ